MLQVSGQDTVVIGLDQYQRRRETSKPWQHLDMSRLPEDRGAPRAADSPDLTGATRLLVTAQNATVDGATISGMVDGSLSFPPGRALARIGSRIMGSVRFTAKLDGHGRLAQLVLDLRAREQPKLPAGTWTLDVSEYGAVTPPSAPGRFTEAPEFLYQK